MTASKDISHRSAISNSEAACSSLMALLQLPVAFVNKCEFNQPSSAKVIKFVIFQTEVGRQVFEKIVERHAHRPTFRGQGGQLPPKFPKFGQNHNFSGSDKEIYGQNQNFLGNDKKNLGKISTFRAVTMIKKIICAKCEKS